MSNLLDPSITLVGDLSKADVMTADGMLTPRNKKISRKATFGAILLAVVVLTLTMREYDEDLSDRLLLGAVIVFPVLAMTPYMVARYRVHQAWVAKAGIFAVADTTIATDGIVMKLPHAVSNIEWPMFFAAMIRPTAIILFYQGAWMLFARSRFPSEHDWNRFSAFVQQRFEIIDSF